MIRTVHAMIFMAAGLMNALAWAGEVRVAVASNFVPAMKELASAFEHLSGHRLQLIQGATRALYVQITSGEGFDVLLSADKETPQTLIAQGLAVAGSEFTYAVGRLALWSPSTERVDAGGAVLKRADSTRVVVPNRTLAPYGRAAAQAIERLDLREVLERRLMIATSTAEAYELVRSGVAPLGFIALGQVMKDGRLRDGSAWVVPDKFHEPLLQDAVLLAPGKASAAAGSFLQWLRSPAARVIIAGYGYRDDAR